MELIPKTGTRSTLDKEIETFLSSHPDLHLGTEDFVRERGVHARVFGFQALPELQRKRVERVEFTAIRGPHGTIPVRIFYPSNAIASQRAEAGEIAALVYFHGGGYTVGTVDEFENGCRILAEEAGVQVYAVEYRLAPEHTYPTQLDEGACVVRWLQGKGGRERGVHADRVCGAGDGAGGSLTTSLCLRLRDQGKKALRCQILLYPEPRLPFDTPAARENDSGPYLKCTGLSSRAEHYLPPGHPDPSSSSDADPYVRPGEQPSSSLHDLPSTAIFTCGFDPLRDVGIELASKLQEAGNHVIWHHYDSLPHGFLQMAPWSRKAMAATKQVAWEVRRLAYC